MWKLKKMRRRLSKKKYALHLMKLRVARYVGSDGN